MKMCNISWDGVPLSHLTKSTFFLKGPCDHFLLHFSLICNPLVLHLQTGSIKDEPVYV